MTQPVFRFAPSPNGYLHLGHAASALLNAEWARRVGGRFLLRIEDIDPQRSRPVFEDAIAEDLDWLGLTWEQPVLRQSEHLGDYAAALGRLVAGDMAYRCFCSRAASVRFVAAREVEGRPWPRDPDGTPFHAGPCALVPSSESQARALAGEPHVWRLRMVAALAALGGAPTIRTCVPSGPVTVARSDPAQWGDVTIARRDVPTSYHLSVVVDDARQGISHVVRGQDLAAATAIHRVLQELLGLPDPLYHHHALLRDAEGHKLAKSRSSVALRALRAGGWTPGDVRRAAGFG